MENCYQIPEIRTDQGIPTLYVKNEPFFALAGEVHNSAAYRLDDMERYVWQKIKGLHLNTLIIPLYWEIVEKEEGIYSFELLDGLLEQAKKHGKHLVYLWFGLWKNGESMYVPEWMKKDDKTYFRAEKITGECLNTISPFCDKAVEKDAAAFAEILKHIRAVDEKESTVIAIQVENEIGLLGTERDYCERAQEAFLQEVPKDLPKAGCNHRSWEQTFGEDAGEIFMAYYFAKAVERIASAGRAQYPLPCYTNVWLKQYPWYPGSYPSGGPVREMHHIWKQAAPSLFTLAPDIYVPYTAQVMEDYAYENNPLFIPEVRRDAVTASYCLYAFTKCNAVCYSPFGIEDLGMEPGEVKTPAIEVMRALNINPAVFAMEGGGKYLSLTYRLIEQIKPLMLRYRGTKQMKSYVKRSDTEQGTYLKFQKYDLLVTYIQQAPAQPLSAGVVFEIDENCFIIAGMMSCLKFRTKPGVNKSAFVLNLKKGKMEDGQWMTEKKLNGDEQIMLNLDDEPACLRVELF